MFHAIELFTATKVDEEHYPQHLPVPVLLPKQTVCKLHRAFALTAPPYLVDELFVNSELTNTGCEFESPNSTS